MSSKKYIKMVGRPDTVMCTPEMVRLFSEYCFDNTAKIASQTNMAQGENKDKGSSAYTAVNVYITDYGTILDIVPNRNQLEDDTDESTMYVLDRRYLGQSFITGYTAEKQGLSGLNEKWQLSVDYTLMVKSEKGLGAIFACDQTTPVIP